MSYRIFQEVVIQMNIMITVISMKMTATGRDAVRENAARLLALYV